MHEDALGQFALHPGDDLHRVLGLVSGMSTTNSSPPKRAITSSLRKVSRITWTRCTSTSSPVA
jgi:hypothetical protein